MIQRFICKLQSANWKMSILKLILGTEQYTPPEGGVLSSNKEVFEKDKRPFHRPRAVLVAEDDARWEKAFAGQYRDRDYLHVALGYKTRDGLNGSLQNKINRGVVARVYDIGRGGRGLKQVFRWVGK